MPEAIVPNLPRRNNQRLSRPPGRMGPSSHFRKPLSLNEVGAWPESRLDGIPIEAVSDCDREAGP